MTTQYAAVSFSSLLFRHCLHFPGASYTAPTLTSQTTDAAGLQHRLSVIVVIWL
jgi:hypothetical protein